MKFYHIFRILVLPFIWLTGFCYGILCMFLGIFYIIAFLYFISVYVCKIALKLNIVIDTFNGGYLGLFLDSIKFIISPILLPIFYTRSWVLNGRIKDLFKILKIQNEPEI